LRILRIFAAGNQASELLATVVRQVVIVVVIVVDVEVGGWGSYRHARLRRPRTDNDNDNDVDIGEYLGVGTRRLS
jgi:hypothetical protein